MIRAATILFSILLVPAAALADVNIKGCILKAAEATPKIAGLRIKKSATHPLPAEQLANWKGKTSPIVVDIDVVVGDQAERYSYVCTTVPTGQAFVRRILSP
jgi:hypothetical protein